MWNCFIYTRGMETKNERNKKMTCTQCYKLSQFHHLTLIKMVRGLQFTIHRVYGMKTIFNNNITGAPDIFTNIIQGKKPCDINKTRSLIEY